MAEAAEYANVVDAYVRAYHAAELGERVARVEQLTDAELMRIATSNLPQIELTTPRPNKDGG
ncbi:hypothetical protein V1292_004148 [Bradyrhizobium sp. AZCC 1719]|uniref:hypothetical protein n=1 Tax=Bradyrhizobium sp. AZCC 1719 TaxID=3117028 RepID=UPI002FEF3D5C